MQCTHECASCTSCSRQHGQRQGQSHIKWTQVPASTQRSDGRKPHATSWARQWGCDVHFVTRHKPSAVSLGSLGGFGRQCPMPQSCNALGHKKPLPHSDHTQHAQHQQQHGQTSMEVSARLAHALVSRPVCARAHVSCTHTSTHTHTHSHSH